MENTLTLAEVEQHYREWFIGLVMLTIALIVSSLLAIFQERLYIQYGKHPREAMFYIVSFYLFVLNFIF